MANVGLDKQIKCVCNVMSRLLEFISIDTGQRSWEMEGWNGKGSEMAQRDACQQLRVANSEPVLANNSGPMAPLGLSSTPPFFPPPSPEWDSDTMT